MLSQGGAVFNAANDINGSLGKVEVTARNLTLRERSLIEGDNLTPHVPGNITVTLSERLSLEGNSVIATNAYRSAPAADLTITAPQILVTGGAASPQRPSEPDREGGSISSRIAYKSPMAVKSEAAAPHTHLVLRICP